MKKKTILKGVQMKGFKLVENKVIIETNHPDITYEITVCCFSNQPSSYLEIHKLDACNIKIVTGSDRIFVQ